jgi:hypothetical protein
MPMITERLAACSAGAVLMALVCFSDRSGRDDRANRTGAR